MLVGVFDNGPLWALREASVLLQYHKYLRFHGRLSKAQTVAFISLVWCGVLAFG